MKKFKVQFIRYDMTKTRNRKRKDMLVDHQSEKAVRTQLERIHKGEQVVAIHELVWDSEVIIKKDDGDFFTGTVKFFNLEKGFGFIEADEEMEDLFFHKTACAEGAPQDRDRVAFKVSEGPKGLIAISVRVIEDY